MKFSEVLKSIEKEKKKYAGIDKNTGIFLMNFCKAISARKILEIGSGAGYSTIWLSKVAKENSGKVISFEYNSCLAIKAENNLKAANLEKFAEIKIRDALLCISDFEDSYFDFIFIDGSNRKYYQFIKNYQTKLKKNGFIVCDNVKELVIAEKTRYQKLQMQKFLAEIKKDKDFEKILLDVGTGLVLLKKIT